MTSARRSRTIKSTSPCRNTQERSILSQRIKLLAAVNAYNINKVMSALRGEHWSTPGKEAGGTNECGVHFLQNALSARRSAVANRKKVVALCFSSMSFRTHGNFGIPRRSNCKSFVAWTVRSYRSHGSFNRSRFVLFYMWSYRNYARVWIRVHNR